MLNFSLLAVNKMQLLPRFLASLFLCFNAIALANLNEKNKVQYPNLNRAILYCQKREDPILQNIDWEEINHLLEQPYATNAAMWLETHDWWEQADAQAFSSAALWLLPAVEDWDHIDTFHNPVFSLLITFYQNAFFDSINAAELWKLLNENSDFEGLLTHLLTSEKYPFLTRFILLYLQQLSNLHSYTQDNMLVILNAAHDLNILIENQQSLNISNQFITGLINCLLTNIDTQITNPVIGFIYDYIVSMPANIDTLNSFTLSQCTHFLNVLVDIFNPLTPPVLLVQHCIQQALMQPSLNQGQTDTLSNDQAAMLSSAMEDADPMEPPSLPAQDQNDGIIQGFILEPPLPNDITGQQPVIDIEAGIGEWELLQN